MSDPKPGTSTRRNFLRQITMAAGAPVAARLPAFSGAARAAPEPYLARSLGLAPVYAAPADASMPSPTAIGHLAPDSVHAVTEIPLPGRLEPGWLQMEHGFVPYTAMVPMRPGPEQAVAGFPDVPAVYEVCVAAAPVRTFAAGIAPIHHTLGFGAVFVAEDRLQDMRGAWWIKVQGDDGPSVDGHWICAAHCSMAPVGAHLMAATTADPGVRGTLDLRSGTLPLQAGHDAMLTTSFFCSALAPQEDLQPVTITGLTPGPIDTVYSAWLIHFEGGLIRGAWWHNTFDGVSRLDKSTGSAFSDTIIEIPFAVARTLVRLLAYGGDAPRIG